MKIENRRNTRNAVLPVTLLATVFVAALTTQGAFAMVSEHDLNKKPTEASESGVLIVKGAGTGQAEVKYIRSESTAEPVRYEVEGPVGRVAKNPAE